MKTKTRRVRKYDHRLRQLVYSTGDIEHATRHGVPRSTARGWLKPETDPVVSVDVVDMDATALQKEVLRLEQRVAVLTAFLRVVFALLRVSGFSLAHSRLPDGARKHKLLLAIERARSVVELRSILQILGLSSSRYYAWKREGECRLDDLPSCPRLSPQQLTSEEIETVRDMVTSTEYRHMTTGALAILAQRLGRVFASPTTWYRLVREYKWRRPRRRVHPAKPKVGVRASRPNEIWHLDTTVIRLLDGTRAYLHAVIDNYSRRILAWKVAGFFDPDNSAVVLLAASAEVGEKPTVLTDGGPENRGSAMERLIESGILRRLRALVDIQQSNSMIESWFRSIKHQWLFMNILDSVAAIEKLVAFYVDEHNSRTPHSAFRGQTPDEMYFGTGDAVPDQLEVARKEARQKRMELNRSRLCPTCDPEMN